MDDDRATKSKGKSTTSVDGTCDDYDILKAIGKGKFSTVYRARRKSDGSPVALKKIHGFAELQDERKKEKCLKEVRLVQSLKAHPNIISYLDSFVETESGSLIIVFEWAEAGDLKRQIRNVAKKKARFHEHVVWKYFLQIANALDHMHRKRIMHRDLKPANVFLMADATVKVGDMGLSRHLSEETMEAFSKVGTPLYMSPEVLRGKGYEWKSDVWSLGCILYELAMLTNPFREKGLKLYALFQKISKGAFEPISTSYSKELRSLCQRMLSVDPKRRPDMSEVCDVARRMCASTARDLERVKRMKKESRAASSRTGSAARDESETKTSETNTAIASKTTDRQRCVYRMMDTVLERLKILDYERHFLETYKLPPLLRHHFCTSLAFSRCRRYACAEGEATQMDADQWTLQFATFALLARWMLRTLRRRDDDATEIEIMDHATHSKVEHILTTRSNEIHLRRCRLRTSRTDVCAKILLRLKSNQIEATPRALARGYGHAVLSVLDMLTKRCMDQRRGADGSSFFASRPYVATGEDSDSIEIIDRRTAALCDGCDNAGTVVVRGESCTEDDVADDAIDAEVWRDELDRVGAELVKAANIAEAQRADLRLLHALERITTRCDPRRVLVSAQMLSRRVTADVRTIVSLERALEKKLATMSDRDSRAAMRQATRAAEISTHERQEALTRQLEVLASIERKLSHVTSDLESRHRELRPEARISDVRRAIARLRAETGDMDVRIGISRCALMQMRLEATDTDEGPDARDFPG